MKAILFLDIDGVLNNEASKTIYTKAEKDDDYSIDPQNWESLRQLLTAFSSDDLKVVIHSGWIKHKDNPNSVWNTAKGHFHTLLPQVISKLGNYYLDCVDYYPKTNKKFKILKWLEKHPEHDGVRKVIVDDDKSDWTGLKDLPNEIGNCIFFWVDPKHGFQSPMAVALYKDITLNQ